MVEAIDHVEVVTKDIEKSIKFYVGILKFSIQSKHKFDGSGGMTEIAFLKLGDSMLELLEFPNAQEHIGGTPQVGVRMFALRLKDMDKELENLKKLGVEVSQPPRLIGTSKRAEIKDPNGISIELRQW